MPENEVDTVSREWLQGQLRAACENVIVLDCRSTNEFQEGHIRLAVNFSIPSIMLRRLAAGKIDLTSTIKCRDLKQRIEHAYNDSVFVLYTSESVTTTTNTLADNNIPYGIGIGGVASVVPSSSSSSSLSMGAATTPTTTNTTHNAPLWSAAGGGGGGGAGEATIINVLHRRLKQDGCRVYLLAGEKSNNHHHWFIKACTDNFISSI